MLNYYLYNGNLWDTILISVEFGMVPADPLQTLVRRSIEQVGSKIRNLA